MTVRITCVCGEAFDAPDGLVGKIVRCPNCGHHLNISACQQNDDRSVDLFGAREQSVAGWQPGVESTPLYQQRAVNPVQTKPKRDPDVYPAAVKNLAVAMLGLALVGAIASYMGFYLWVLDPSVDMVETSRTRCLIGVAFTVYSLLTALFVHLRIPLIGPLMACIALVPYSLMGASWLMVILLGEGGILSLVFWSPFAILAIALLACLCRGEVWQSA